MNDQLSTTPPRSPGLWAYNIRILLGNSYWLIITPLAAAQLVLFWNMAVVSMSSPQRAVGTVELVAPILAAFLCAHALAPEQGKVGELVFVRPVSIERVLVLRIVAVFAFVLLSMCPVLILYHLRIEAFPLGTTVLAALPSMLLLSVLALGIASAVHHPLLGFAAAGAFWVVDLLTNGALNPLMSLQSYAGTVSGSPFSEMWVANKLVLLGLAALLYLWIRSMLGRPAAPLRFRVVAARSVLALAIVFAYVVTGAGVRLGYGLHRESQMGPRAHLWYQTQFSSYGPVPVGRLFGPAFSIYVNAAAGAAVNGASLGSGASSVDVSRLRLLQERYPNSIWADNAQLLIALNALAQPAVRPTIVISYQAGRGEPSVKVSGDDLNGGRAEFEALVERYPDSPFAPFALSQLAVIGLSTLDLESAISANRRLLERYPEAPEAGLAGADLSAYHLNAGEPDRALQAADVAAGLAPWDVRADALFAAARAAQTAGKLDVARDRYARAREAASDAGERAIRGERSPSHLAKDQLFERVNAVIAASTRALAGRMEPRLAPAAETSCVTGRVVLDVSGATAVRVALGRAPDATGLPSPFVPGPAVAASAGPDGAFVLASVSPGPYQVLAIALSVPREKVTWSPVVSPPSLPVEVRGASVEIPPVRVGLTSLEVRLQRPAASRDATARSRRGGRDSGGRRGRR
ncbi:MAG: hypothetical protein MUQ65_09950 [Armatimonadetes bacterium]|nr:hypothetical protein [Armatimonadota bacterium]